MHIPDHIHEELINWSRWCWTGAWPHPLPATHCGSLESHYRAPPDWNPDDAPTAPAIRPNDRNARIVQKVWESLPNVERLVLKAEYPARHLSGRNQSVQVAAARMGIPVWMYQSALGAAISRVGGAFDVVRKRSD